MMTDVNVLLSQAVADFSAGRMSEAESKLRRILAAEEDHADALHLLGVIALQAGHPEPAAHLIGKAINADRRNPS